MAFFGCAVRQRAKEHGLCNFDDLVAQLAGVPVIELTQQVRKTFNLTPAGIIETLQLRRPIFKQTAAYGHFGRETKDFTWENTDKAEALNVDL